MNISHIFTAAVLLGLVHLVGYIMSRYVSMDLNWYAVIGFVAGAYYFRHVTIDEVRLFRQLNRRFAGKSKHDDDDRPSVFKM